jgi:hypothetical protein
MPRGAVAASRNHGKFITGTKAEIGCLLKTQCLRTEKGLGNEVVFKPVTPSHKTRSATPEKYASGILSGKWSKQQR